MKNKRTILKELKAVLVGGKVGRTLYLLNPKLEQLLKKVPVIISIKTVSNRYSLRHRK